MQLQRLHLHISLWNITFHLDWVTVVFLFAFFYFPVFMCTAVVFGFTIRGRASQMFERCWFYISVIIRSYRNRNRNWIENQLILTILFFFWDMESDIPGSSCCWRWKFDNIVIATVNLVKSLTLKISVFAFVAMIGMYILVVYSIMVKVMFWLN